MYKTAINFLLICTLQFSATTRAAEQQRNAHVAIETSHTNQPRVALVIGNAAYPGVAALKNPVNDANDFARRLKKFNFNVTLKTNVGLRDMLRTLTSFGDSVQPGSEVIVFYAGHGMQVRGRNYLVPIDAEIRTENAVSSEAVDVDQLLDKLSAARLSIVILDACRNNPFERRFRGNGQGLASINAPTGTLIAYATAPGKVASDGDGRNGLYTQELLAAMEVPGIKVEDVFKRVRMNVIKKSGETQTPWESSSLTGDFFFSGLSKAAPQANTVHVQTDAEIEQELWDSVKNGDRQPDIQHYLAKYPDGRFAALAKNRLGATGQPALQVAPSKSLTALNLRVGKNLDRASIYPMQICDYSRPVSSILEDSILHQARTVAADIQFENAPAEATLIVRPVLASLAKATGQNSDFINTMRVSIEGKLVIGDNTVLTKTYDSQSTSQYASCCSCSAWDAEINSELRKNIEAVVNQLLKELANFKAR